MSRGFASVIDATHNTWFVFGRTADGAAVDIADSEGTVLEHVPADLAEQIVSAHNDAVWRIIKHVDSAEYAAARSSERARRVVWVHQGIPLADIPFVYDVVPGSGGVMYSPWGDRLALLTVRESRMPLAKCDELVNRMATNWLYG